MLFKIFEPRWHDRVVLLKDSKIGVENEIIFTKTPSMPGKYYVSGEVAKNCPLSSNGRIAVRAVPLSKLKEENAIQETKLDRISLFDNQI